MIYPNPLQSNPWYKKISIWIFPWSKIISRIVLYKIEKNQVKYIFNWRKCYSWINDLIKPEKNQVENFCRPWVTLLGIRVFELLKWISLNIFFENDQTANYLFFLFFYFDFENFFKEHKKEKTKNNSSKSFLFFFNENQFYFN